MKRGEGSGCVNPKGDITTGVPGLASGSFVLGAGVPGDGQVSHAWNVQKEKDGTYWLNVGAFDAVGIPEHQLAEFAAAIRRVRGAEVRP